MWCIRRRRILALGKIKAVEPRAPCPLATVAPSLTSPECPQSHPGLGGCSSCTLMPGQAGLNNDLWYVEAIFCGTDFSVFGLVEIAEERWRFNLSLQRLAREWSRWDAGASLFRSSRVIHLYISSTPHMIVGCRVKIGSLQYIWCLLINSSIALWKQIIST